MWVSLRTSVRVWVSLRTCVRVCVSTWKLFVRVWVSLRTSVRVWVSPRTCVRVCVNMKTFCTCVSKYQNYCWTCDKLTTLMMARAWRLLSAIHVSMCMHVLGLLLLVPALAYSHSNAKANGNAKDERQMKHAYHRLQTKVWSRLGFFP